MEHKLIELIKKLQVKLSEATFKEMDINKIVETYNLLVECRKVEIECENNKKAEKSIKTAKVEQPKKEKKNKEVKDAIY